LPFKRRRRSATDARSFATVAVASVPRACQHLHARPPEAKAARIAVSEIGPERLLAPKLGAHDR
jgi:hypothetical protein